MKQKPIVKITTKDMSSILSQVFIKLKEADLYAKADSFSDECLDIVRTKDSSNHNDHLYKIIKIAQKYVSLGTNKKASDNQKDNWLIGLPN